MGWKSTHTLSRADAIDLIIKRIDDVYSMTNDELANAIEGLGYGETPGLSHYGCNFSVFDTQEDVDKFNSYE